MVRKISFALLLVVLLTSFVLVTAQGETTATTRAQLNVRSGPGTEHPVIASIDKDTMVVLEGRNSLLSWLLVRSPDGTRGWVSASYLTLSNGANILSVPVVNVAVEQSSTACTGPECGNPSVSQGDASATVQLNVRSGPGQGNTRVGRLPIHTAVMIEGRNGSGDWALVSTLDGGLRGWVSTAYLTLNNGKALANYPVLEEAVVASEASSPSSSSTSNNSSATVAASYAPEGRSIWQANSGPDVTSGTCSNPPLVMCSHMAAITLNDNGTISWRGQELKTYTMRQSSRNPNVYSYSGRNGLGNADIQMVLSFNSASAWSMTMTQVFDDDPKCTHTFYYTSSRNW